MMLAMTWQVQGWWFRRERHAATSHVDAAQPSPCLSEAAETFNSMIPSLLRPSLDAFHEYTLLDGSA